MSTVVVVRKNGVACIAADSLTSYGDLKLSADFDPHSEKIQTFDDNHLAIVGSAAHTLVIEELLNQEDFFPDFSSRAAIFKTFTNVHSELKEHFFLNTKDEDDDPYESSHIDALAANKHGIFGIYAMREVYEYSRFWATGSGSPYALGAMQAVYDRYDSVETIAQAGVLAGATFDNASSMPMTSRVIQLQE
ncbi:MFS transporter [Chromatiales bacterium (ex Bugula neritina AB1)]|nr:MFS transporter [Chromatiales bacterium (ex Bugula neritina AB1)]